MRRDRRYGSHGGYLDGTNHFPQESVTSIFTATKTKVGRYSALYLLDIDAFRSCRYVRVPGS